MRKNLVLTALLVLLTSTWLFAQKTTQKSKSPSTKDHAEWSKPYPAFQIAGNLYYVGTYDLACYLIVTSKGSILINTGLAASWASIKTSIERLGFKFSDIKILLNTQAHYDHMGAMATIKKMTGSKLMMNEGDVEMAENGGMFSYASEKQGRTFKPVKVDRVLHDQDTIKLGSMQLVMLHHPGHTKGSCSYLFDVKDKTKTYRVLIANLPTIVTDKKLTNIPAYPNIAKDYSYTFNSLKNLQFDIWLASHGSQFDLIKKHKPNSLYNPEAFIDRNGYDREIKKLYEAYNKKL